MNLVVLKNNTIALALTSILMLGGALSAVMWTLSGSTLNAEVVHARVTLSSSQALPVLSPLPDIELAYGGLDEVVSDEAVLESREEFSIETAEAETEETLARKSYKAADKVVEAVKHVADEAVEAISAIVNPVPGARINQGIHGKNGVDLGADVGTVVRAAQGGTVKISSSSGWNGGYGAYITIKHPDGTETLYAHLNANYVSSGEKVSAGQAIGEIGMTGRTTGPHLHFEVHGASNPLAY